MKTKLIYVQPKSSKAKDRFDNEMNKLHSCRVEQRNNGKLFLSSINKQYFFSMLENNDEHWEII